MRWILLCLIFFNGLYFGWEFYYAPARNLATMAVSAEPQAPAAGRIVLLREVLSTTSQAVPPPSINPQLRQKQLALGDPEVPDSGVGDVLVEGEFFHLSQEVVPSGRIDASVGSIALGGEDDGVLGVSEQGGPQQLCARIGPYDEESLARELLAALQAAGVNSDITEDAVIYDIDNWVIIPPAVNRAEALRLLRLLQDNKIDSYLITEGEFTNGISLGLFKQLGSAQGVLATMKSTGYEAEIHQIERFKKRFWVGFSGEFEPGFLQGMLTQLVDHSGKINFSETLCEIFASSP